jgi:hypothetical protein
MTEYLLAVTMMWVTPQGKTVGEALEGSYTSHLACTQALTQRTDYMTKLHGIAPVPVGTELCVPHERKVRSKSLQDTIDGATKAAADAAAKVK